MDPINISYSSTLLKTSTVGTLPVYCILKVLPQLHISKASRYLLSTLLKFQVSESYGCMVQTKLFINFVLISMDTFLAARRDLLLKDAPLPCAILLFTSLLLHFPPDVMQIPIYLKESTCTGFTLRPASAFQFQFYNISRLLFFCIYRHAVYIFRSCSLVKCIPVSYTHLDVYKRQNVCRSRFWLDLVLISWWWGHILSMFSREVNSTLGFDQFKQILNNFYM